MRPQVLAATIVAAIAIATLALSMPADGFFSGDPGVKLVAAFNAIEHPSRPFDIDLPAIEGTPTRYVERFFWLHGDHSHVLQSPVFPVVTAPLIAAFGLRGAYLLPALAFVLLVPLLAPVFEAATPGAPLWLFLLIAVAANPVLFYALEYWEHLPAVALLAAATALMWRTPVSDARALSAGALTAGAVLLRPEAVWYAVALGAVVGWRGASRFAIGAVALLVPAGVLNNVAFGTPLGPHAAANLAPLADRWLDARVHRIRLWLVPASWLALAGVALVLIAHAARLARVRRDRLQVVALAGAALLSIAAASGKMERDSLWQAWPAGALVLAYGWNRSARPLVIVAMLTFALVILTSTHDGGAQWGPRFLLIATPALIPLSAWAAAAFWCEGEAGAWRTVRRALVIAVLAASVFVSRNAFRELRASKRYYARLTAAAARLVPERGYVVTNAWWFDQITATLYGRHTVLNVTTTEQADAVFQDLQAHAVRDAVVVTSPDEPAAVVLGALGHGNCFVSVGSDRIQERNLTFTRVRCR